ncbi:Beta-propeller repeat protein [compost metagenome]
MRISTFSIFLLLITSIHTHAQEPDFAWVKRIGDNGAATANIYGPVVAVDQEGNSYLAGVWLGQSYTLDGIPLTSVVPGSNNQNGYIAKYDPNGQIIWAKSMTNILAFSGVVGTSYPNKILVDEQQNIYFCALGSTDAHSVINGHYLTNPSAPLGQLAHKHAMFLSKLDADGNVLWVKKVGHPSYVVTENIGRYTNEIHFDLEGNVNMTGAFHGYVSFSPGDTIVTGTNECAVFLAKYAPSGSLLLSKKLAGVTYPKNQFGTEHVRADASGNLYRWSSRFHTNPKCLYRYNPQGEYLDSVLLGVSITGLECKLNSFAVNSTGDAFIGGYFMGNITLGGTTYPGFGNPNTTDAVLIKLAAPNYEVEWVKTHLTQRSDSFEQLLADAMGNVYATGQYGNAQEAASVIRKYSDDGTLIWSKLLTGLSNPQNPNTGFVNSSALCQARNGGNIWVGGRFSLNAYFSPADHFATPSTNHYNGFLVQYGLCNTENPEIDSPLTTVLCGQESLTLSADLDMPGMTYYWSTPTGMVAIGNTQTTTELTVTEPGKYYLVAQENAECYGKSQEIWVTQAPLPDNGITEQDNTLTATEIAQGTSYQWLDCTNNYAPINGADDVSFTPAQNGTYSVKITSAAGCTDTSACFTIDDLGIHDNSISELISIYPNPASDEVSIQGVSAIQSVRVLDLQGKELMRGTGKQLVISSLSNGVYLLEIKTLNGIGVKSFVKE